MKAIKKNMKDQILTSDTKILWCPQCGAEYSGNGGDYWNLPDNHVFKCVDCKLVMVLVNKIVSVRHE